MFTQWSRDLSRRLGVYKFMPVFFFLGAAIELFMIKVRVGNETFYDTVIRKESERRFEERDKTTQ